MDREQEEVQFMGLSDIYVEAYKLISGWRKIFSQITLSLILPLSFVYLAHLEIAHLLHSKIRHNEVRFEHTESGTQNSQRLAHQITSDVVTLWLFRIFYFTFFLVLLLLSTAAVVYTVACVYIGRVVTFRKVMSVIPKVWKRLMVTFLCSYLGFGVYNVVAAIILVLCIYTLGDSVIGDVFLIILLILYAVAFVYLTIIWQLASVVSVLEESQGLKAMMKSKDLIKGKMLVSIIIFFTLNAGMVAIQILFYHFVIHGGWGTWLRVILGMLCFLLLCKLILFGLVIQTIIYFVCKSYHHENIDKLVLSSHLEVYLLGEYVPLKPKDVQLEQYDQV